MTELGHLLVADRAFVALGWAQVLRPSLYLGAIAPDAHRATIGVDYRDLHFRSSRTVGRRLIDFLRHYLRPALRGEDGEAQAFYLGWLSHICADHLWRQYLRHDLSATWYRITEGTLMERTALRDEFYEDCDCVDQLLYTENRQQIEDARSLLQYTQGLHTVSPLRGSDILRWRKHVLMELLPPAAPGVTTPQMLTLTIVERCLTEAVEETLSIMDWEVKRAAGQLG